ncbi:MAG: glycosyltransferase family 9 protein [bacterium]
MPLRRLIIRPGAIGDCILSLPAMEHLRADYTEVWVARQNVPLIRFADRVRAIQDTGLDLLGLPDVEPPAAVLRALAGFDSIVSWYGATREEFRTAVGHLPFTFLRALPEKAPEGTPAMHAADWFLMQAGGSGTAVPRIECRPPEPQSLQDNTAHVARSGPYAVIHPFSGSPKKNWPLEWFRAVAARLSVPVCWCAGPEEELDGAVRFDNLYELACWLAQASLYIGNDSGITHLAAAVGTPVVALFGPTDPAVWAPRGPSVCVVRAPGGRMENLGVDDVLAALERAPVTA